MKNFSNNLKNSWKDSISNLKELRTLTICGMMGALAIALGYVATIEIGPFIRIGISWLPNRILEFMFGPFVGMFFSGILDILKFLMKPTGMFFPGFTISAMLGGLIFGFILYKKPLSFKRILFAEFLIKFIINSGLNTVWLSMLLGKSMMVMLPLRILKNFIMWPIDSILLFYTLLIVSRIAEPLKLQLINKFNSK